MPLDLTPDQLLRWYMDSGVDETIGETPQDRFALSAKPAVRAVAPPVSAAAAAVPLVVHHAPQTATHVAGECRTLEELRLAMEGFDGLALKRTAMSTVFADGNPDAAVMIIGEAPGQDEDRQGRPFLGASGKLLDRMLASIGLDRDSAYLTYAVPWRPVESPKPSHDDVSLCLPFIIRHIELADPQLLILLGGASASALLARHEPISRLRGQFFDYSSPGLPRPIPALATFHPAYLLSTPAAKRDAWRHLLQVKTRLGH
ncbi:MAG: uracil-DNA glycosylase [Rhodospirillaceae bacterium]|nr:uracil-DNA glycosylase [Rhodospirillales bacterium]